MGFRIEYEALSNLNKGITGNKKLWCDGVNPLYTSLGKISESDLIEGELANGIEGYFSTVHKQLLKSLKSLVELHEGNFALFYSDFRKIDSDKFARIESTELDDIKGKIKSYKGQTDSTEAGISEILRSINDIFSYSKSRNGSISVLKYENEMTKNIETLKNNIESVDSAHNNNDFVETGNLISSLKKLINECNSKNREYKATFTVASLSELKNWAKVYVDSETAKATFELKEADITIANEEADKIAVEIQEYKKRESEAKWIKLAVFGAGVLLSAAAIVLFPGVGAIVAGAVVGAISGAANKATEIVTDNYVETGSYTEGLDVKDTIKKVAVAAAVGGVAGAIGGAAGVATKGVENVAIKIGSNIGEEVVSGIYGRKIESTVDAVDDLAHGRTDFRSAVEYVAEKTYDGKELGKDVIKGSIKGVTSAATEHAAKNINVGGQSIYDSTVKNSNAYVEIASKGVKGSVDKTITGVSDRYINQRIDGYAPSEALREATDWEKVSEDVIGGGIKGGAGQYRGILDDVTATYATVMMY